MSKYELTLVPSYGHDYKTEEEAIAAWNSGKDFKIVTVVSPDYDRYTSIQDMKTFPGTHCKIRYNNLTCAFLVNNQTGEIIVDDMKNYY